MVTLNLFDPKKKHLIQLFVNYFIAKELDMLEHCTKV